MRKREKLVKNWMTREVVTISPSASLPEAHRLMADNDIRRLPVIKLECLHSFLFWRANFATFFCQDVVNSV